MLINQVSVIYVRDRELVDAGRIVVNNLVARVDRTRFIKNNVKLIPRLNSNTNKEFIVTANHNANDAWKVFTSTTGYFWNSGVVVDDGRYVQQISIQIKLPTSTRIHKIGLRARSDTERIKSWSLRAKNEDGVYHTIYILDSNIRNVEDRYIGGTVKYFDIPLRLALNYMYYSLLIDGVDSRNSYLTFKYTH